jgi:hypothetical protein
MFMIHVPYTVILFHLKTVAALYLTLPLVVILLFHIVIYRNIDISSSISIYRYRIDIAIFGEYRIVIVSKLKS